MMSSSTSIMYGAVVIERMQVCVLSDVRVVVHDVDPGIGHGVEELARSVRRSVVPDHDLSGLGGRPGEDARETLLE